MKTFVASLISRLTDEANSTLSIMTLGEFQKTLLSPQAAYSFLALEDFFVLVMHVTGQTKTFLLAHPEYTLEESAIVVLKSLIERRLKHEPTAYLTGYKEFYGRDFNVSKSVLIPRPETELLIEAVLNHLQKKPRPTTLLDIGTGSGALILTLAEELSTPLYSFVGSDISVEALKVANENKKLLNNTHVTFIKSDLLENISLSENENICIIANLPYLPTDTYESTEPDVRNFEPMIALVSGDDGLDHYRRLIHEIEERKLINFTLFLEIDPSQTEALMEILKSFHPKLIEVIKDLTGRDRFIKLSS